MIAELADWRWAFGVNLIVGPLAFAGVVRLVPDVAPRADARRPDVLGTVLVSGALTAVTFAIVQGVEVAWAVAATLFAAFAITQRVKVRRGAPAILDPVLTRVRSFSFGNVALLIVGVGEFGLMFLLPLVQQAGQGLSPIEAGLVGLPGPVFAVIAFPLMQAFAAAHRRADDRRRRAAARGGRDDRRRAHDRRAARCGSCPAWRSTASASAPRPRSCRRWCWPTCRPRATASRRGSRRRSASSARRSASACSARCSPRRWPARSPIGRCRRSRRLRASGDETAVAHAADALANGIFAAALVAAAFLVAGAVAIRLQPRRATGYPEGAVASPA